MITKRYVKRTKRIDVDERNTVKVLVRNYSTAISGTLNVRESYEKVR